MLSCSQDCQHGCDLMSVLASLQASTDKLFMTLVPQSEAQSPQFYHYCGTKSSKYLVKWKSSRALAQVQS